MKIFKTLILTGILLTGFSAVAQYFPCAKENNNCKSKSKDSIVSCSIPFSVNCSTSTKIQTQFYEGIGGELQDDQLKTDDVLCEITGFSSFVMSFQTPPTGQEIRDTFLEMCFDEPECAKEFQCERKWRNAENM